MLEYGEIQPAGIMKDNGIGELRASNDKWQEMENETYRILHGQENRMLQGYKVVINAGCVKSGHRFQNIQSSLEFLCGKKQWNKNGRGMVRGRRQEYGGTVEVIDMVGCVLRTRSCIAR